MHEDGEQLHSVLASATLPPLNLPPESASLFDQPPAFSERLDYSGIIAARRAHETEWAKKSARAGASLAGDTTTGTGTPSKAYGKLVAKFNEVLRDHDGNPEVAVGTGLERLARISGSTTIKPTGNSANAALAAGQRASTVRLILCSKMSLNNAC